MSATFDMDVSLLQGEEGEKIVLDYFTNLGEVVDDIRGDLNWRQRDVDFVIGGSLVEVKTDAHHPRRIFLELTYKGERPGSLFLSRADYFIFVFPKFNVFYRIAIPELALYVAQNLPKYTITEVRSNRGRQQWVNTGIAVPVADLMAAGVHVEKFEF